MLSTLMSSQRAWDHAAREISRAIERAAQVDRTPTSSPFRRSDIFGYRPEWFCVAWLKKVKDPISANGSRGMIDVGCELARGYYNAYANERRSIRATSLKRTLSSSAAKKITPPVITEYTYGLALTITRPF